MSAEAHALLGPSGAARWMTCTPSARLEENEPDKTSEYAEEGTAAHRLAELYMLDDQEGIEEFKANNSYYCGEMEEAVQDYLDIVNERYQAAKKTAPDAILMPEQRLEFTDWVPEGFGTGDAIIIAGNTIEVIDLKYGKGVPVEAEGNPQLKIYGLGAYATYNYLYDLDTVRMTIVQPRLGSVTTAEISTAELLAWAETEVKPAAVKAWAGEGEQVTGDHCRFCRVKPKCRALRDKNLELAKYEFSMPYTLDNAELAEVLDQIDDLANWAKAVKEYALAKAEAGEKFPGYKLVEGRSNRIISDEKKALKALKDLGYKQAVLYKPREILGITALEKLVGKAKLAETLGDILIKPAGKPTLVKESDKRPEINTIDQAQQDFK